jgi:hypothetical protein
MVNQQQVMSEKYAALRAEHEKLQGDAKRWKANLIDVKEILQSQTTVMDRGQEEHKDMFVKVMICRKGCRNKEFSVDG